MPAADFGAEFGLMEQTGKFFLVEGGCCEFVKFVRRSVKPRDLAGCEFVREFVRSSEFIRPVRVRQLARESHPRSSWLLVHGRNEPCTVHVIVLRGTPPNTPPKHCATHRRGGF